MQGHPARVVPGHRHLLRGGDVGVNGEGARQYGWRDVAVGIDGVLECEEVIDYGADRSASAQITLAAVRRLDSRGDPFDPFIDRQVVADGATEVLIEGEHIEDSSPSRPRQPS